MHSHVLQKNIIYNSLTFLKFGVHYLRQIHAHLMQIFANPELPKQRKRNKAKLSILQFHLSHLAQLNLVCRVLKVEDQNGSTKLCIHENHILYTYDMMCRFSWPYDTPPCILIDVISHNNSITV